MHALGSVKLDRKSSRWDVLVEGAGHLPIPSPPSICLECVSFSLAARVRDMRDPLCVAGEFDEGVWHAAELHHRCKLGRD